MNAFRLLMGNAAIQLETARRHLFLAQVALYRVSK